MVGEKGQQWREKRFQINIRNLKGFETERGDSLGADHRCPLCVSPQG